MSPRYVGLWALTPEERLEYERKALAAGNRLTVELGMADPNPFPPIHLWSRRRAA